MKKIGLSLILVVTLLFSINVDSFAEEDTKELKAQVEALQRRIDELEAQIIEKEDRRKPFYRQQRQDPFFGGWDPFAEMEAMQERMDAMFDHSFGGGSSFTIPAGGGQNIFNQSIDLQETDQGYELTLDTEGLNQEKIDVEVDEYSITIKGEYSAEEEESSPDRSFHSKSFGSFMKTIPFPTDADITRMDTQKKDNQLIITIPKK